MITINDALALPGCKHDILGHYLKAIGLLRVLAKCADHPDHADPEAEGWWDMENAYFCLRSQKYGTIGRLTEFFEKHYRPTPVFADETNANRVKRSTSLSLTDYFVAAAAKLGVHLSDEVSASEAFVAYRDAPASMHAELLDAVSAPRFVSGSNNPLWLSKGRTSGKGHIWSSFGEYVDDFEKLRTQKSKGSFHALVKSAISGTGSDTKAAKGKGTPFFPDAIKGYNFGAGWVKETYPFNALDYILAVEGAFALRGGAARVIGANARRFAAFPFVFDTGEEMLDDSNKLQGTAHALWLPLWDRATTYAELASFISDAQARLPNKDARYSAEFVRALNAQGVDAGFAGWQEFRFKMKGSRVPWVSTGALITHRPTEQRSRGAATLLNRALDPLDASLFLDQFAWQGQDAGARSPHRFGAAINSVMETAALEPTPRHCLALLETIFAACRQMCISDSFRNNLRGGRATFFAPLPMAEWDELLHGMEAEPEFRIARALASLTGQRVEGNADLTVVEPMLGSILPLKVGRRGWYLPEKDERHHQDVWTGSDLALDLAAVLQRRYMDSARHPRPALRSPHGASLPDVLSFLRGELDEMRIARWTEALSLIGWHFTKRDDAAEAHVAELADAHAPDEDVSGIPPAYAALRTLLEIECEWQDGPVSEWKKHRSQQPFTLVGQRSLSNLPLGVSEALRWLSIWGVPNPWGAKARAEKPRLSGRYVVSLAHGQLALSGHDAERLASRLAAAVCIPLAWEDRWQLARVVTLPPGD